MKAVIQRVSDATLKVDGNLISQIKKGFLVLLGVEKNDTENDLIKLGAKISKLRIFEDENGKLNLALKDVGGEILCVSQFTQLADCKHGNRPSFVEAELPERANELYEKMCDYLISDGQIVKKGIFGADMKINFTNDGPVTIILNSKEL